MNNADANLAALLLDRLDVSPDDDARVDQITEIVRGLAADRSAQAAEIARLSAALAEKSAQLEEERARNAAPKVVGYLSKTGHGTYFRETITPALAELEWCGTPMWRAVAFVDAAPALAIISGAKP